MTPSIVFSRPSPCNVPQGYASVAELPAVLLDSHFEHPAKWFVVSGYSTIVSTTRKWALPDPFRKVFLNISMYCI